MPATIIDLSAARRRRAIRLLAAHLAHNGETLDALGDHAGAHRFRRIATRLSRQAHTLEATADRSRT